MDPEYSDSEAALRGSALRLRLVTDSWKHEVDGAVCRIRVSYDCKMSREMVIICKLFLSSVFISTVPVFSFSVNQVKPRLWPIARIHSCEQKLGLTYKNRRLTAVPFMALKAAKTNEANINYEHNVSSIEIVDDEYSTSNSSTSAESTSAGDEVSRLRVIMKEAVRDNAPRRIVSILQFDSSPGSSDLLTPSERAEVRSAQHALKRCVASPSVEAAANLASMHALGVRSIHAAVLRSLDMTRVRLGVPMCPRPCGGCTVTVTQAP